MHLRHGRRYCLGYCSDMRTEAAGNVAPPSLYRRHACEDVDSEEYLIFLCKVTARETEAREWRTIALDEIRTRRILREKADCKQSSEVDAGSTSRACRR